MTATPPAALQTGASGASGVAVERRRTRVLDARVDRVEATRKLPRSAAVSDCEWDEARRRQIMDVVPGREGQPLVWTRSVGGEGG